MPTKRNLLHAFELEAREIDTRGAWKRANARRHRRRDDLHELLRASHSMRRASHRPFQTECEAVAYCRRVRTDCAQINHGAAAKEAAERPRLEPRRGTLRATVWVRAKSATRAAVPRP